MRSGASSLRWIRLIIRAPLSDATISYSLRIYGEACLAVFPGLPQDALQAAKPKSKSLGDPRPREGIAVSGDCGIQDGASAWKAAVAEDGDGRLHEPFPGLLTFGHRSAPRHFV